MTIKLAYSQLTKCPELKENPFRKRICKIFSTDNSGDLSFNDFMLLFSRYYRIFSLNFIYFHIFQLV